ncbi:hypothetical protein B4168_2256 [Anoxybacillus flavithermus]|nr:hypothetical protein B4168_2256 [Anoxybacillus flavithermus]OAO85910.1 hypothetical protein GT23_2813 [Parageobacillus thermoglucosidasius]
MGKKKYSIGVIIIRFSIKFVNNLSSLKKRIFCARMEYKLR